MRHPGRALGRVVLLSMAVSTWPAFLPTRSAAAAEPTKSDCVAANESAQDLRRAGKLREARASLAVCTATSCPSAVREDCAQRLKEVEANLPTVVFVAKDAAGRDLSAVRVTMDSELLLTKLDGFATAVDPGEHQFRFDADGFRSTTTTAVIREGDMDRPVHAVLASTSATPVSAETSSSSFLDGGTRRSLGLALGAAGAAGVVVGAIFGFVSKGTYDHARSECPTGVLVQCPAQATQAVQDLHSAQSQATVSTIAFVAGGALLAGGAIFFLTAPKAGDVAVAATVANGGGGLSLRGRW